MEIWWQSKPKWYCRTRGLFVRVITDWLRGWVVVLFSLFKLKNQFIPNNIDSAQFWWQFFWNSAEVPESEVNCKNIYLLLPSQREQRFQQKWSDSPEIISIHCCLFIYYSWNGKKTTPRWLVLEAIATESIVTVPLHIGPALHTYKKVLANGRNFKGISNLVSQIGGQVLKNPTVSSNQQCISTVFLINFWGCSLNSIVSGWLQKAAHTIIQETNAYDVHPTLTRKDHYKPVLGGNWSVISSGDKDLPVTRWSEW